MPANRPFEPARVDESTQATGPQCAAEGSRVGSRLRALMTFLAIAGLVLPWVFNVAYFAAGGSIAPSRFWRDASANHLTTAITLDVYLAAIAFAIWVLHERRVRRPWLHVLLCFGIGLSFALPWYLSRREPRSA